MEPFDAAADRDGRQRRNITEYTIAKRCHAVGNGDLRQRRSLKGIVAEMRHILSECHLVQLGAAPEAFVGDRFHTIRENDLLKEAVGNVGGIIVHTECTLTDLRYGSGNLDGFERCTRKGKVTDPSQLAVRGKGDRSQRIAVSKHLVGHFRKVCRNRDRRECCTIEHALGISPAIE